LNELYFLNTLYQILNILLLVPHPDDLQLTPVAVDHATFNQFGERFTKRLQLLDLNSGKIYLNFERKFERETSKFCQSWFQLFDAMLVDDDLLQVAEIILCHLVCKVKALGIEAPHLSYPFTLWQHTEDLCHDPVILTL
jgi:hypothetical protein